MKLLIWGVTGFLALLWTGAAAMMAAAVNWLAASSADPALQGAQAMIRSPLPEWLALWMPPGVIEPLMVGITGMLDSAIAATSWLVPMFGWLSPVIWVVWGLLMAMMLVLAGGVHLLAARSTRLTA